MDENIATERPVSIGSSNSSVTGTSVLRLVPTKSPPTCNHLSEHLLLNSHPDILTPGSRKGAYRLYRVATYRQREGHQCATKEETQQEWLIAGTIFQNPRHPRTRCTIAPRAHWRRCRSEVRLFRQSASCSTRESRSSMRTRRSTSSSLSSEREQSQSERRTRTIAEQRETTPQILGAFLRFRRR